MESRSSDWTANLKDKARQGQLHTRRLFQGQRAVGNVETPEQALEALKVDRERKTKAAVAHAAMLKAHSEARERRIRAKHERQMCRELVLAIVSHVSNCVEACELRDVDGSSL